MTIREQMEREAERLRQTARDLRAEADGIEAGVFAGNARPLYAAAKEADAAADRLMAAASGVSALVESLVAGMNGRAAPATGGGA